VYYVSLIILSEITLDGRMLYFISAVTVRQPLEALEAFLILAVEILNEIAA
jgi:hypothetical protein